MSPHVAVIGAGLTGVACAGALRSHGVAVDLIDRGHRPGGRMASPTLHGRVVDTGAAYFTAKDPEFVAIVDNWSVRGLVRGWTDTIEVFSADGHSQTTGPLRYATPGGLRSLVADLAPADLESGRAVDTLTDLDHDAIVLAMPDPQAARLAPDAADWVDYEPVIAVVAAWPQRIWSVPAAAFVNDDPDLTMIADDGSRRGDGAAVLVTHTTAQRALAHLDDPEGAVAPALSALQRILGITSDPLWTHAHRWTFAKPSGTHGDEPFSLGTRDGRPLGICGDSWCPSGAPRVESAWLSGHRLGAALAGRLRA
ncbi:NAD(P)/FAD-dependent oxidoreductase [Mycolicibacterium komossense]|uniref:FAD-dependent oxidoreductase n=1 Tax=Mycolicibacterium komossense TaxID=1779 RepID=A0ABT3C8J9_9MYCO|nr:FAD-dependent oxidoreductase [Mycolicibacterium komossense]MCV7225556.1 FAD-dependent oxidoreductase [Mycolicibacterium komossense]